MRLILDEGVDDDDDASDSSLSEDEVCCLYGREATVVVMEPLSSNPTNVADIPTSRPIFIRLRTLK